MSKQFELSEPQESLVTEPTQELSGIGTEIETLNHIIVDGLTAAGDPAALKMMGEITGIDPYSAQNKD